MRMRYRRADIVDRAIDALDVHGLDGLSMRTLAAELGVRASALYHHFDSKQALLDATADEILRRGRRATEVVTWEAELRLVSVELRDAMRAHRDGAGLVAGVLANGTGGRGPELRMADALRRGGAPDDLARIGARLLVRFVLAHVDDDATDFALGLGICLDGLSSRVAASR